MDRVTINGVEYAYEITGSGEPLVLFNGGFLDRRQWMLVAPTLASSFRVVTFDLPGHGESSGRIDDPVAQIVDLAALVEWLELGPVHVHGHSGGGLVALQLAARRPELVRSLSVHEPALMGVLSSSESAAAQEVFASTAAGISNGDVDAAMRGFFEFVGGDWSLLPPPMRAAIVHNAAAYGDWFGDLSHPIWHLDASAIGAFPRPILLTRGGRSTPWQQAASDAIEKAFPAFEVAVIEDAGHAAMFEQPVQYAHVLSSFIERAGV